MATTTRRAYVRRRFDFELRDEHLAAPAADELLIEVAACSVCGTDMAIAGKTASDWQQIGHEIAGIVRSVGPGVLHFAPGDRVALDSSAPCGSCLQCAAGRPLYCTRPASYWGRSMGFADFLLAPQQLAFHCGELPATVACMLEPAGVSIDMVETAEVGPGDRVLIIGPGPLGLLAIPECRRRLADRIWVAGRSHSTARLAAALALGADEVIEVDRTELSSYDFGPRGIDKVLVVAPPSMLPAAVELGNKGSIVSYIGIAWDESSRVTIDADALHFKRQQLRSSMASPGIRGPQALALLSSGLFDPLLVLGEHFPLGDLAAAMNRVDTDKATAKKSVMVNESAVW